MLPQHRGEIFIKVPEDLVDVSLWDEEGPG